MQKTSPLHVLEREQVRPPRILSVTVTLKALDYK